MNTSTTHNSIVRWFTDLLTGAKRKTIDVLNNENAQLRRQIEEFRRPYRLHSPAWDKLIRTIYIRFPHLGYEQADDETILLTFIDDELSRHDKVILDYYEAVEDGAPDTGEPVPPTDLTQASAALASLRGKTFERLAYEVEQARHMRKVLNGLQEYLENTARTYKGHFDQLLPVAEDIAEQNEELRRQNKAYRRTFAILYSKWTN